ncbi:Lrp/AsnC family transcriptional regulator [Streptomyces sp. NPDC091280]|uniref:Lrp/AsnC family transcriptional regulator n=1 Tax=Streptomyces sp. NPDC091280 TaxID=3365984 RepID=UPI00380E03DA
MHETAPAVPAGPGVSLDELDLALVTALQVAPRAPWSQLAGPLGVDAATLSRRWARLREAGVAWVTCYPAAGQVGYAALALIEVSCVPQAREDLAQTIARHPQALGVEVVSGSCDLLLTVATGSMELMSSYVLALGRIASVTATRTHLVQHLNREGSRWRFDSLSRGQQRDLAEPAGGAAGGGAAVLTVEERRLVLALGPDGRRPVAALAAELGRPESSIRRALGTLLHGDGKAVLRCEASLPHAGWHSTATLWMSVAPTELALAAEEMAQLKETRLAASTASEANLLSVVWLHALDDLARYEARLAALMPSVRVLNRVVTLRWVKRMGRLLSQDGRSVASVPMDLWQPIP